MRSSSKRGRDGDWRWRLRTTNGNVVADSAEGYRHRDDCERGIAIVKTSGEAPIVDLSAKVATGGSASSP